MTSGECLEPNQLVELMAGRVSDDERARIEAHVNGCEDCMQLMIDMGRAHEQVSPVADTARAVGLAGAFGDEDDELVRGDVVDHFQVERLLGRGGMGVVYRAHDIKLGRTVALKLIHPRLMTSSDAKARFENEARATAKLNHPGIVNIHAVGEYRGRPYVALEYLEGKNLREHLMFGPLEFSRAISTMLSIAEAVAAAHERGVVHRDLKPENVIVDQSGRVRVVDFGLARIGAVTDEGVPASVHGAHVTTIGGTPLYMAPEQWRLERAGAPADVWALGVMLYELTARQHPFIDYSESDIERLKDSVTQSQPPELALRVSVPPHLSQLVARCLDKNEDNRPRASEVAAQLRYLLQQLHQPAPAPEQRVRPPPSSLMKHRRASRRAQLIAGGAVLVAGGALAWGWHASRSITLPQLPVQTSSAASVPSAAVSDPPAPEVGSTPVPSAAPSPEKTRVAGSLPAATVKASAVPSAPPLDPHGFCTNTADCKNSGRCHEEDGACVVKSNSDCQSSTNCKTFGNCALKAGRCAPTTAAHCQSASRCASWGMCTLANDRCTAVHAADCKASSECKAKGLCTPNSGWCTASSDADCQASQLCSSQGRCRLDAAKGQCAK
jgi:serine/threonine-protein kinase